VQNPSATDATVSITYMDQDGNTAVQTETVAANGRFTQKINDFTVDGVKVMNNKSGVSTTVTSTNSVGVIAERSMYWFDPTGAYWVGGHDSIGTTSTATTWYLAEGCTTIFDTFVLVQNPSSSDAEISITYMDQDGNTAVQTETVSANGRFTQKINDYTVDGVKVMDNKSGVSTKVESTNNVGVIVERSMYWLDPTGSYWVGGHDCVGYAQ